MGYIVVSACLGYLLPELFTYALYLVIVLLFLVIYLAKQDKLLGDSKIYDKKQDGYHKVKCISKELG